MTKSRTGYGILLIFLAVLFLPLTARADAGIPMLPIAYPVVLLFLVPVIAIEAIYLRLRLKTAWWNTIKATAIVNAVTLVLGYPLAWLLSLALEFLSMGIDFLLSKVGLEHSLDHLPAWLFVILFPAWLGPWDKTWPVLVAFVVLLIPSYFLSGFVESRMMLNRLELESSEIKRAVWRANLLSYAFLAAAGTWVLYLRLKHP
jgi:hypothetical protein